MSHTICDQRTIVTNYAILIGIDNYLKRPLTSCERDVQDIKDCLGKMSNPVYIQMITTQSSDITSCDSIEIPVLWPSYENVTSTFQKITSLANAGDFVYIHYSGHGTRTPSVPYDEFSNKATGDLALVLLTEGNNECYLKGSRLAVALKAMVDKGIVVTLVLDCCFSAAAYRDGDPTIRFLPYDSEIDSNSPPSLEGSLEDSIGDRVERSASRDASMLPNWFINPDGYAILTACGPHQFAKGLTFDGQTYGALSYFLLRTFKEYSGLTKKHKHIYHHLCAMFLASGQPQNPVLYGNKEQGFFGHINARIDITPISIIVRNGEYQLQAGQAHGVCDDDQFTVYPWSTTESDFISKEGLVIAKVTQARPLTSSLEVLGAPSVLNQTDLIAYPLTRLALGKFPIQLASSLPNRDEYLAALREQSLNAHIDIDQHPFSWKLLVNKHKEYEILNEFNQKINNLPTMLQDQTDISVICDIIEHLSRNKLVRDLRNKTPADPFKESFEAQIIRSGEFFNPEYVIEVEQGAYWEVQNIYSGSYVVIPPQDNNNRFTGIFKTKIGTIVPPEMIKEGYHQCEDIIKVFVTSRPTSFELLELPELSKSVNRGAIGRTGREDSAAPEEWAAFNFPIRTFLN
ncbi:hypothetical protein ACMFMG_005586 [Clarireedia jacksonii]